MPRESQLSWKQLIQLYKKIKIPWTYMIIVALLAIGMKEIQVLIVPYQTKIMTGAITEHGFLTGFLVLSFASVAVEAVQGGINELTSIMTARNTRHTVWGHLMSLPMKFFRNREPQEYVSRITQDTTGIYAALAVIINLISILYGIASAFRRMYATYNTLALIMLSGIPVLILCSWMVGKMQYKVIFIQNTAIARMTGFFAERLPSLLHIKTCSMEDEEYIRGVEANDARYRAETKAEIYQILIGPVGSFAQTVNQVVLLLIASALVRGGSMEMYHLVNLYNYYLLFMGNAYMLIGAWQSIKMSHGAASTIAKVLDEETENLGSGESMPEGIRNISFEHVSFSYDGVTPVLRDVSFTIPKGMKTVLVGENGSGKSTLIKLLERFEEPISGMIRVGDRDIREINLYDLREKLGYLSQGNQIIKGTIAENIRYGINRECSDEEMFEAARTAQAYDFICSKEKGFDTVISRFDNKCSGGEMQRIAAARMILKDPDYLIMDEAVSGIDVVSARAVVGGIDKMMKGKTVISVSHDPEEIKAADNIIVLRDGEVEACGSYEQVCHESELMRMFIEQK